jgi:hypothetical protein
MHSSTVAIRRRQLRDGGRLQINCAPCEVSKQVHWPICAGPSALTSGKGNTERLFHEPALRDRGLPEWFAKPEFRSRQTQQHY